MVEFLKVAYVTHKSGSVNNVVCKDVERGEVLWRRGHIVVSVRRHDTSAFSV